MTQSIENILQADPVSLHIMRFLLKNRQAMDSVKGISAWWVGCDEVAVQAALDRLIACGVLNAYTFRSCTLYGLTQSEETRGWLETWLNGHQPGNGTGASARRRGTQPRLGSLTVIATPEQSNA